MLKRFFLALALMAGVSPSFGAGTVPGFSLTPQYDLTGHVAFGCKLYVYQAGTTSTPQIAYQDTSLTIPSPAEISCHAMRRGDFRSSFWPMARSSWSFGMSTAS
jgi:hypothetical protein